MAVAKIDAHQPDVLLVVGRVKLLFSEIFNTLTQMAEKKFKKTLDNSSANMPPSRGQLADLKEMLHKEKAESEESLQKDNRLVHAASVNINSPRDDINDLILENMVRPNETLVDVKSPVDSDASEAIKPSDGMIAIHVHLIFDQVCSILSVFPCNMRLPDPSTPSLKVIRQLQSRQKAITDLQQMQTVHDTKPYIKLRSLRSVHWDQQVVSELVVKL
ncbi:hypothetical protein Tco_1020416 [Tanacetum coccineum]